MTCLPIVLTLVAPKTRLPVRPSLSSRIGLDLLKLPPTPSGCAIFGMIDVPTFSGHHTSRIDQYPISHRRSMF